jgi:hypothetical protein
MSSPKQPPPASSYCVILDIMVRKADEVLRMFWGDALLYRARFSV